MDINWHHSRQIKLNHEIGNIRLVSNKTEIQLNSFDRVGGGRGMDTGVKILI